MHLKIYGPNSVFIFTTETISCKNFKKLFANIAMLAVCYDIYVKYTKRTLWAECRTSKR